MQTKSGMIRKLDDVGRIVIPKEIRRYLRLRDGSPLEIGINDSGEVVLRANNNYTHKLDFAMAELHKLLQRNILLVDNTNIIMSLGCDISGIVSDEVVRIMKDNQVYSACVYDNTTLIPILKNNEISYRSILISPITIDNNKYGIIIFGDDYKIDINNTVLIEFVSRLIQGLVK